MVAHEAYPKILACSRCPAPHLVASCSVLRESSFCGQVPKSWLELVVTSCGGVVGWEGEGSPFSSADPGITHQVRGSSAGIQACGWFVLLREQVGVVGAGTASVVV